MPEETQAQIRARQRANSLKEQQSLFRRTGRLTKGLANAGYLGVPRQDYVVQTGDSPFKVASALLGQGATQSQIAAFAQSQGWSGPFRAGEVLRVRGSVVAPDARPSSAYMAQVSGQVSPSTISAPGVTSPQMTPPGVGQAPPPGSGVPSLSQTSSGDMLQRKLQEPTTSGTGDARTIAAELNQAQGTPPGFGQSANPRAGALTFGQIAAPVVNALGQLLSTIQANNVPAGSLAGARRRNQPAGAPPGANSTQQTGPYLPAAPTGSQPTLSQQEQSFFAAAAQERSILTSLNALATGAPAQQLPVSISAEIHDGIPWPTDPITGMVIDPYVPTANGGYVIDPQFATAVAEQNAYLENFSNFGSTTTGSASNPSTSSGYTGWRRSDATGISPFRRPRRTGLGASGSDMITPADMDAAVYGSYAGGGLSASWNIGF